MATPILAAFTVAVIAVSLLMWIVVASISVLG
jgi:hypothetical protein